LAAEPHGLPDPTTAIIGQIGLHLSRMAEMVYAIDEAEYQDHRRTAFVDCFLLDFRALSYFLWGGKSTEVRCYDFVDIKNWQPRKTDATKRMHKLAVIVSKHRAHLSWSRFVPTDQDLQDLAGIPDFSAEFLGRVLLDLLDILDDFISKLPDDTRRLASARGLAPPTAPGTKPKWRWAYESLTTRISSRSRACGN
jgi:hypothetical protein